MVKAQGRVPAFEVFARSFVGVPLTGTLTETALATVSIPANTLGVNGALRIKVKFSCTNSSNAKTVRVRLGGAAGTTVGLLTGVTTSGTGEMNVDVWNRNSQSSQVCFTVGNRSDNLQAAVSQVSTTVDTAVAQDLVIQGTLANIGETLTLEGYVIEILR